MKNPSCVQNHSVRSCHEDSKKISCRWPLGINYLQDTKITQGRLPEMVAAFGDLVVLCFSRGDKIGVVEDDVESEAYSARGVRRTLLTVMPFA